MERDCLISHGAASFMRERLFEQSDPYCAPICKQCGLIAEHACTSNSLTHRAQQAFCRNCRSGEHVVSQPIPYSFKLLMQEAAVRAPPATSMPLRLHLICSRRAGHGHRHSARV
jgi:DNA-directed RNA polymerase II subunit RPB2